MNGTAKGLALAGHVGRTLSIIYTGSGTVIFSIYDQTTVYETHPYDYVGADDFGAVSFSVGATDVQTTIQNVNMYTLGARGPSGPTGPSGLDGVTGATGPRADTGPTGPSGLEGVTGATGPSGPSGPEGVTGATGPVAATGPSGAQGVPGVTGATGPKADTGPVGATGPLTTITEIIPVTPISIECQLHGTLRHVLIPASGTFPVDVAPPARLIITASPSTLLPGFTFLPQYYCVNRISNTQISVSNTTAPPPGETLDNIVITVLSASAFIYAYDDSNDTIIVDCGDTAFAAGLSDTSATLQRNIYKNRRIVFRTTLYYPGFIFSDRTVSPRTIYYLVHACPNGSLEGASSGRWLNSGTDMHQRYFCRISKTPT